VRKLDPPNQFGGSTSPDIFYQGDQCPDRPSKCFPGNPENVALCNETNWDSRPDGEKCYVPTEINVVEVLFRNDACKAGIFLSLKNISIEINNVETPLAEVLTLTPEQCGNGITTLPVCWYVPQLANASWTVKAKLDYGPVSPQCESAATNSTEDCANARKQCETIAANMTGSSASAVCGARERNSVTIQALNLLTLNPV
jgi:hypothetical protein